MNDSTTVCFPSSPSHHPSKRRELIFSLSLKVKHHYYAAHTLCSTQTVVFLSCPLVKKHADLSGSFLYSQLTMKDMYSKPTNRTELSIPMKTKSLGGEERLTTQWLAALRVKIFKAVVFEVFMAVVLSGCQCWSPKGGRREKGAAGALLFEVLCPLCCSRSSLGPPDDLSSCSFEGQYAPRDPENDENTDSSGQPPGVGPTKIATTYVTQSGGLWVPVPLSKPTTAVNRRGTRAEATRKALTFKTRRGGKDCVVLKAQDRHRVATTNQAAKLEPGLCTAANQRNGPRPNSQAPGLLR